MITLWFKYDINNVIYIITLWFKYELEAYLIKKYNQVRFYPFFHPKKKKEGRSVLDHMGQFSMRRPPS